jgi:hypothetical protein
MVLHATADKSGLCPRCNEAVRTVQPWPHWGKVRYGYFAGLFCALCCGPVIFADGFVLIPCLMLYMSAIGPLNSLAKRRPTCAQCGAVAVASLQELPRKGLRLIKGRRKPRPG